MKRSDKARIFDEKTTLFTTFFGWFARFIRVLNFVGQSTGTATPMTASRTNDFYLRLSVTSPRELGFTEHPTTLDLFSPAKLAEHRRGLLRVMDTHTTAFRDIIKGDSWLLVGMPNSNGGHTVGYVRDSGNGVVFCKERFNDASRHHWDLDQPILLRVLPAEPNS